MMLILALQAATNCVALGQWAPGSPSDLIRVMATPGERLVIGGCGSRAAAVAVPREAARKLAGFGRSVLPDIERAIASVERDGGGSVHVPAIGWLALAYAKVDGAAAYPTLRRLLDDPGLRGFRSQFISAITIALDLSGYVDRSAEPERRVCRPSEPRDALAKLIFARESGDRKMIEESLGAQALHALEGVSSKDAGELSAGAVVRFRLENRGAWSRPEEDPFKTVNEPFPQDEEAPSIQTEFVGASGQSCGRIELKFLIVPFRYLINNGDIAAVLHMIEACAAR